MPIYDSLHAKESVLDNGEIWGTIIAAEVVASGIISDVSDELLPNRRAHRADGAAELRNGTGPGTGNALYSPSSSRMLFIASITNWMCSDRSTPSSSAPV